MNYEADLIDFSTTNEIVKIELRTDDGKQLAGLIAAVNPFYEAETGAPTPTPSYIPILALLCNRALVIPVNETMEWRITYN